MNTKRIAILYTGGTIGMQPSDNGLIPAAGYLTSRLQQEPRLQSGQVPAYDLVEYEPLLDSSDMEPHHWQQIAEDIAQRYSDYDGFLVLHGTDTLAYTASALSFLLPGIDKPVIVTGSQLPLAEPHSDGHDHIVEGLMLAAKPACAGVNVLFHHKLLPGNRVTKSSSVALGAFTAPNAAPVWVMDASSGPSPLDVKTQPGLAPQVPPLKPCRIGVLTLTPGMPKAMLVHFFNQPLDAVILRSYGAGNAPQQADFMRLIEQACEQGTVVVNLSQCDHGGVAMGTYAGGSALARAGVISGGDMTLEACYSKLVVLLSHYDSVDIIRERMQLNLAGELTQRD
ncbi:L-asparaginase 1 [Bacterioplanes sanyensis]|uniref:type I asparaginase n=1 Tax=Bacterioplanes sanyensis TaxID=1249553 RepID=UPI00167A2103|nr:type I asparaginase [Bacterioplanes sanyensis]GGY48037.1 L-asparaginase 1 [Bacterioplanes sanyensis]